MGQNERICNIIRISATSLVTIVKWKRDILGKKVLYLFNAIQQVSLGYSAVLPDTYNGQELLLAKCLDTSKSQIKYRSQNVSNQTVTCVRKYRHHPFHGHQRTPFAQGLLLTLIAYSELSSRSGISHSDFLSASMCYLASYPHCTEYRVFRH